ncbi:MAG: hypothetical protein M1360_03370 [Candidatus Marsarchaeota archaeon]|nr:hypothetical protein [Candidatus Marsarchaeota archaeon]MCL5418953.1 hypothetical protein [Candidatus Marsarchaeota archaeon]
MRLEKKLSVDNAKLCAPLLESCASRKKGEDIARAIMNYPKSKGTAHGNILDVPCATWCVEHKPYA